MFFRAYIVDPSLSENGQPIGGLKGTLKIMQKLVRETSPDKIVVCWDGVGGSQRKKAKNKQYKQGRNPLRFNRRMIELDPKSQDENRIYQQIRLYEYLNEMPIIQVAIDGIEADEIIGNMKKLEDEESKSSDEEEEDQNEGIDLDLDDDGIEDDDDN